MGIRVTVNKANVTPGYSGSPVADSYLLALRPLQGSVDSLGGLGGTTQRTLQAARSSLDAATVNPMSNVDTSILLNTGSLNNNLGIAIRIGPQRHSQPLSGITGNISRMSTSATSAFDYAKYAVSGTNGVAAIALMAACILIATLLQGEMSKLTAGTLRMQRTLLAKLDRIRKQVVDLIEEGLSAAMEVLPECPQQVKDVIQELRSILGKSSTIVAAVSKILRDVAVCMAIGAALAGSTSGYGSSRSRGGILGITNKTRVLVTFDLGSMQREYKSGIYRSKGKIESNRAFYHENPYMKDTTTGNIKDAKKEAEDARDAINRLIEDSKKQDGTPYPDSPEYKDVLDKARKDLDKIIEDLNKAEVSLLEETLDIIDNMSNSANEALDGLQSDLDSETDEIKKATDEIFEGLESIAKEFDSPEVLEKIATACAETQFRTIIDK